MKGGPSALLILLTRFARTYGAEKCYPGQTFLAKRFKVNTRTIRRWTEQLVSDGKLKCQRRGPRSILYSVLIQRNSGQNVRSNVRSFVRSRPFHPYINSLSVNGEEYASPSLPVENPTPEEQLCIEVDRFAASQGLPLPSSGAEFDRVIDLMHERKPAQSEYGLSLVATAGKS